MTDFPADPDPAATSDAPEEGPTNSPLDHSAATEVDDAPDSTADTSSPDEEVDLVAIERDLDAVEAALARLADGTYRTDEVTGDPIPDEVLAGDPTARRA